MAGEQKAAELVARHVQGLWRQEFHALETHGQDAARLGVLVALGIGVADDGLQDASDLAGETSAFPF